MTNWVTIKIPEGTRDDAKEIDDLAYHELLMLGVEGYRADVVGVNKEGDIWANIDQGDSAPSQATEDQLEAIREDLSMAADPGVDEAEIVDDVVKRIDDLETELKTQIEALGR